MYYALIILSVIMFGANFALKDAYRKIMGSSLKITLQYSFVAGIAGIVFMIIAGGFKFEFTWFTFIFAFFNSLNGILFTFCSFKALGVINLSLYSVFSMLGGMVLPFAFGIIFYGEPLTLAKSVCFIFIVVAIIITYKKGKQKKSSIIYYAGVFILNGMSGVYSKFFTEAPLEKTSAAGYSTWVAIWSLATTVILLLLFSKKLGATPHETPKTVAITVCSGGLNKIANYILVLALAHVDSSVQYPMVTGGVMIVSTIVCFLQKNRPSNREILSVTVAFIGLLALFALPV
ncbi:MAG: hypothetical protein IJ391_00730 [Clostridia bacterium]|nr:hypothetical protein [Clostridia bacterium]